MFAPAVVLRRAAPRQDHSKARKDPGIPGSFYASPLLGSVATAPDLLVAGDRVSSVRLRVLYLA